jgi:hypothetical protein
MPLLFQFHLHPLKENYQSPRLIWVSYCLEFRVVSIVHEFALVSESLVALVDVVEDRCA